MFYAPTDVAVVRSPVQITVQIDSNNDGIPDQLFRSSELPSNYAKYLNDVSSDRLWQDNRGPYFGGAGGWEATGLVPTSGAANYSSWSFDARNYFTYQSGSATVSFNAQTGTASVATTAAGSPTDARNKIGVLNSNGVTAYSYIPNPPFHNIYDLFKIIDNGEAPNSFQIDGATDAELDFDPATGLTPGVRVFSGPSLGRPGRRVHHGLELPGRPGAVPHLPQLCVPCGRGRRGGCERRIADRGTRYGVDSA